MATSFRGWGGAWGDSWGIVDTTTTSRLKRWNGVAWVAYTVKHWTGSAWVEKPLKYWNGASWI